MTLDRLYMPIPLKVEGKRVTPLGEWPELDAKARRLDRYKRYYDSHRAQRIAYQREYRQRKAA